VCVGGCPGPPREFLYREKCCAIGGGRGFLKYIRTFIIKGNGVVILIPLINNLDVILRKYVD